MEQRAEVMFTGGHIWTGVERLGPLDSVAVRGGRVVAMGSEADLAWARGPRTRVIPLGGRLLVPAFGDAHVHPLLGGLGLSRCWLTDQPEDIGAYLATIADYAAAHPERPWIVGEGWSMSAFPGGVATAALLDAIVPDRPAYLESRDGHSVWLNTAALGAAGIGPATADPAHGRIERDAEGNAIGTLQEHAIYLVSRHLPPTSAVELEEGLHRGQAELQRQGIGSWQDAHADPAQQAAYLALAGRGELTGRAAIALLWDVDRGLEQVPDLIARRQAVADAGAGRGRAQTVKIFQDGIVENGMAAMLSPYLDAAGRPRTDRGESIHGLTALRDLCVALDDAQFSIHAHAIGDRAVREVLDALTAARRTNGPRDSRHQIAHLQFVDPEDLPRFGALGVIANLQPYWAFDDGAPDDLTRAQVGDGRADRMYPFGSLARLGAPLAIGSDWSVTTPDPMALLEVATRRVDPNRPDSQPLGPSWERLSAETAMRAYTRGSAVADGLEDETGTIELGRPADLVLLDQDPMGGTGVAFRDTRVLLTMVDGRVVWEDPAVDP
ncbi:MAG: amidohydrolase [Chloroflexi bacterium]|nr:amidohydrolase [Chloroflexota bacterium]